MCVFNRFHTDQKLHGILYIHRITDIRMDGAAARRLSVFHNICGPEFVSNTVMITSMWDKLREPEDFADAEEIEEELIAEEWESLLGGGATYARSYNTQQCCEDIVRKIVAKSPKAPTLQEELGAVVDLGDTAAGSTEIDKPARLHKEELEGIVHRHAQALEDGESNMIAVLAKEKAERESQVIQERSCTTMERQITDLKEETGNRELKSLWKTAWEAARLVVYVKEKIQAENQRAAEIQAENQRAAEIQAEWEGRYEMYKKWVGITPTATATSMSTPISNFDHYKLETQFHDDYVSSPSYEWESSIRRQEGPSKWRREKEIGVGAFGSVWLEKSDRGQLRAVKSLHQKGPAFLRELLAFITLLDVCVPIHIPYLSTFLT